LALFNSFSLTILPYLSHAILWWNNTRAFRRELNVQFHLIELILFYIIMSTELKLKLCYPNSVILIGIRKICCGFLSWSAEGLRVVTSLLEYDRYLKLFGIILN
jgi:hypothetical protein